MEIELFFDESGNLGKQDDYFVFSAFWTENPKRIKNLVKKYRVRLKCKELKGAEMSPSTKIRVFKDIRKISDQSFGYLVIEKSKLEPRLLEDKNIAYNYCLSFLVKECIIKNLNANKIVLNIDNKDIKTGSQNSFADYIKIKAFTKWGYTGKVEVKYWNSDKNLLIQIADLASNTVYQFYEKGKKDAYKSLNFEIKARFPQSTFFDKHKD